MYTYRGNIISYNAGSGEYQITKDGKEALYKPELAVIPGFEPEDFMLKILFNQKAVESSIFEVHCDNSDRVGWLFPLQALLSNQHDFHDKPFFLKQAYVAYYLIIEMIVDKIDFEKVDDVILTDFLNENCQILLLEKRSLNRDSVIFTYEKYAPSLLAYGYTNRNSGFKLGRLDELGRRIKLRRVSEKLEQDAYILTLFRELIPSELDELSRFHVLYQTVEVMINIIFQRRFELMLQRLQTSTTNIYVNETAEELKNLMGEKERVRLLFTKWSDIDGGVGSALLNECKAFLDDNGYPVKRDLFACLYGTRNLIVHSMYKLDTEGLEKLRVINEKFLYVLVEMVNTFAEPTES